jgi:hypothetical protein
MNCFTLISFSCGGGALCPPNRLKAATELPLFFQALVRRSKLTLPHPPSLLPSLLRLAFSPTISNKVRTSKQTTASNKNNGMSTEELLAQQELLFAKSRAKYAETGGAAATEGDQ